jgi:23S rRNA (uracil1939-C5)-methyltransferase
MSEIVELELSGMAHGGSAVGRYEGRAMFVPYGIPGERVAARIIQDKGRFLRAELVEVLTPVDSRIQPRCPHFGHCGGCHWQHIDYPAQLEFKRQIIHDQMRRIGGFTDVQIQPVIPSPSPWEYRSHATFRFDAQGRPAFVSTDGRTVMPIEECYIIQPALLEQLASLHSQNASSLTRFRLQVGSDNQPIGFEMGGGTPEDVTDDASVKAHTYTQTTDTPATFYRIKHRTFRCSAGSFFQVNLPQAETLVDLVLKRLTRGKHQNVLDLYCGVGLFTAFIAEQTDQVTGVELFPLAVRDAEFNLSEFDHVSLYEGPIDAILTSLKTGFDAAVVDPPRTGIEPSAMDALLWHSPARIIYISCDPATFARDAKKLAANGYRLLDIQPVDMFPQTYHTETVGLFAKK